MLLRQKLQNLFMKRHVFFAFIILVLSAGCSKDEKVVVPVEPDINEVKAKEFEALITGKGFRPTAFYSDKPIDYIEEDSVIRSETELTKYIKTYLTDDKNVYVAPSSIRIEQNELKIPGNDSANLIRNFKITHNSAGVYLDFVDYNYLPLRYRLQEFTNNYFIVYVNWQDKKRENSATLFSRFDLLP